jgi:hypothetical protein
MLGHRDVPADMHEAADLLLNVSEQAPCDDGSGSHVQADVPHWTQFHDIYADMSVDDHVHADTTSQPEPQCEALGRRMAKRPLEHDMHAAALTQKAYRVSTHGELS